MICFADKLTQDRVYEGIKSIIAASRKLAGMKPETRQQVDDFEAKVEECRNKGIEENADEADLQRQIGLTPPKAGPRNPRRTPSKSTTKSRSARKIPASRRRVIREDDDDEEEEDDEGDYRESGRSAQKRTVNGRDKALPPPAPARRSARERKAQVQRILEDSEEESD